MMGKGQGSGKDKRVLLVTLWDQHNYGNQLQAYAMQAILRDMGYQVVLAIYESENVRTKIRNELKSILGIGFRKYRLGLLRKIRKRYISQSMDQYFPNRTKKMVHYQTAPAIDPSDYAAAVAGSDQVWHKWTDEPGELPFFYLSFMPEDKRIAYAASFGFSAFPEKDGDSHVKGLAGMRFISCREQRGCELVRSATGKEAELVLDPTMCLEPQQWEALEKKPSLQIKAKYMLVFLLGNMEEYREEINEIAKREKLEVINLYDKKQRDVWRVGVDGFLWLIHHAEMIYTDSFHCSVFSILFQKPLVVVKRTGKLNQMFDRLENLLNTTGLSACIGGEWYRNHQKLDYSAAGAAVSDLKMASLQWLKDALDVCCSQTGQRMGQTNHQENNDGSAGSSGAGIAGTKTAELP